MLTYRLALLNGNTAHLSGCTVRGYITLSSHTDHIKATAARLNALVCGWRVGQ